MFSPQGTGRGRRAKESAAAERVLLGGRETTPGPSPDSGHSRSGCALFSRFRLAFFTGALRSFSTISIAGSGGWGQYQGNRIESSRDPRENCLKGGVIPSGAEPFAAEVLFEGSVLLENREGQAAESAGDFLAVALADPAPVL